LHLNLVTKTSAWGKVGKEERTVREGIYARYSREGPAKKKGRRGSVT